MLLICLLASSVSIKAQRGNSWINYDLEYVKITTGKDDIYRVTYESLESAGMTVAGADVNKIRMFHRGEQVAIRVIDDGDGIFGEEDYVEFYGRRNDGVSDVELFNRPRDQIHQFINLFSDSTAFFLTVDAGGADGMRMMDSNESGAGLTPVSSHQNQVLQVQTSQFSFGQYYPIGNPTGESKLSKYDAGQMFVGDTIMRNEYSLRSGRTFRDFRFDGLSLRQEADGKPELEVQIVGFNNRRHNVSIFVGPDSDNLREIKRDLHFNYNDFIEPKSQIEWSDVSSQGRLIIRVEVVGFEEVPDDRVAVSYIQITYPQETDIQAATEKVMYLPPSASNQLVEVQNAVGELTAWDVTDYRQPMRISTTLTGSTLSLVVPASAEERKIFIKREDGSSGIQTRPVELMDFKYDRAYVINKNFVMISHSFLRNCEDCDYTDPVQAYIDYRSSVEGGSHRVLYADVEELFNEFNYGEYSPLAIRRFMEFAYTTGNLQSESNAYLFIVGKSRRVDNQIQRLPQPLAVESKDLVPTMGAPGSDILFTEGLSGFEHYPDIPVGRLSVSIPRHVGYYLDKVIEKESAIKNSPWTKNFIQLSGGLNTSELVRFREFIDGFKNTVEGDFLGANVTNLSKESNNAVQKFNISEEINRGVGFVTFFGHSSATFTDIDIGAVTDDSNGYFNKGLYPAFLVNGCRGGEIFFFNAFGENWLAAKDRGAVNYMAHSDVGISSVLEDYTSSFYELLSDTLWMTRSIGHIQQRAIANFLDTPFLDELRIATAEQTVLQGDPSIPLFGHDQVDYTLGDRDIFLRSLDGNDITSATQFFELGVVVSNGGRTTRDGLTVRVNRRLSDGTVINLPAVEVPPIAFRDTIYYQISNTGLDVLGDNSFEVLLDPDNLIEEGNEVNNTAQRSFNFPANGTFNTSPANFSIVDDVNQRLVVQSADLRLNDKTFVVQLDTTNTFDSPFFMETTLTGKGLATWDVQLLAETEADTMRYYWRSVFSDELSQVPVPWRNNTFTFIRNGPDGWAQTEFDQFEELNLSSVRKDEVNDNWFFAGTETTIDVVTYGINHPQNGRRPGAVVVDINGDPQIPNRPCRLNTMNLVAFNKDSGRPYFVLATPGEFDFRDTLKCGKTASVINSIPESHLADIDVDLSESLIRQYVDGVDEGDSVLMFSVGRLSYQWPQFVVDDLERLGVSEIFINNQQNGEPFIAFGAKGSPAGTARTVRGIVVGNEDDASPARIEFSTSVVASTDSGTVETPAIGPASRWGRLTQYIDSEDGEDELTFEVRGVALDGTTTVLFPSVTMAELDLSSIDSNLYPFLRLFVNMEDRVSATAPQLNRWAVTFEGVPEGVVSLQNEDSRDVELIEGQPLEVDFKFSNISPFDFPAPLTVRYTITNQITGIESTETLEIPAVAAGSEENFTITIDSRARIGLNDLEVFVNPGGAVIEQFDSNNIIRLTSFFNVLRDEVNPNLDVTFDGIYILDGDIVSPTPLITVELRDNNPFLLKTDGSGVDIKMGCTGCPMETIDVSSTDVEIIPATESSNFRLEFRPDFLSEELGDGTYRLEVEVPDASGNQSGVDPYTVTFEVVSSSSITNFYPYPNPFSTSTRFVFTLTGSEIPDRLKIQIFTVSGKLVREITQEELGPIRIGQNISQYAWDGRDEFGDQLANGTYLYRVKIEATTGTQFGKRATRGDQGFNNGFGKLVILR